MNTIIHRNLEQGSPRWHELRKRNFTASELGAWVLDPKRINLTVEKLKAELTRLEIPHKGNASKDTLLELLPNHDAYKSLCQGARTAIYSKITDHKFLILSALPADQISLENGYWLERYQEMQAKEERAFEYNIPVKYGRDLEPLAREWYIENIDPRLASVGFVERDGWGCSPDGVIFRGGKIVKGLEIKCPLPTTHLGWLDDGILPDEHRIQVHACMAATGAESWDFLSYCPGDKPLFVTVKRDDTTERLERGIQETVTEMRKMKTKLNQ